MVELANSTKALQSENLFFTISADLSSQLVIVKLNKEWSSYRYPSPDPKRDFVALRPRIHEPEFDA